MVPSSPSPNEQALDWFVRLTSGDATEEDACAFQLWRDASPEHRAAIRETIAWRDTARTLDALRPRPGRAARPSRRMMIAGGGTLAASLAGVGLIRPPYGAWPSFAELTADQRTAAGERRHFSPRAGVIVEMNGKSSASTEHTAGIELLAGEMYVAVAASARQPFAIDLGSQRYGILGGSVNVRAGTAETSVTCLTGRILRTDGAALRPGEQVVDTGDARRLTTIDPAIAVAWRRGLLIFEATPLGVALDAVSRYLPERIVVTNAAVARRTVTGVFHTNRVADVLAQFQSLLDLTVRRFPGGLMLVS